MQQRWNFSGQIWVRKGEKSQICHPQVHTGGWKKMKKSTPRGGTFQPEEYFSTRDELRSNVVECWKIFRGLKWTTRRVEFFICFHPRFEYCFFASVRQKAEFSHCLIGFLVCCSFLSDWDSKCLKSTLKFLNICRMTKCPSKFFAKFFFPAKGFFFFSPRIFSFHPAYFLFIPHNFFSPRHPRGW